MLVLQAHAEGLLRQLLGHPQCGWHTSIAAANGTPNLSGQPSERSLGWH